MLLSRRSQSLREVRCIERLVTTGQCTLPAELACDGALENLFPTHKYKLLIMHLRAIFRAIGRSQDQRIPFPATELY